MLKVIATKWQSVNCYRPETPRDILEMPKPLNYTLQLIEKHFIEQIHLYVACKIKHLSHTSFVCNSVTLDDLTDLF